MSFSDRHERPEGERLIDRVSASLPPEGARRRLRTGVHALLVALLEEAISCLLGGVGTRDSRRLAEARRAEQWFRSRDATSLFAFESVCNALDLEVGPLRSEILRQANELVEPPSRQRRSHAVPRRRRRLEYL